MVVVVVVAVVVVDSIVDYPLPLEPETRSVVVEISRLVSV
jgi:hypothetical protein